MMKKILLCTLSILSLLLVACNNGDKGLLDNASNLDHYAKSLVVTPKSVTIPVGFSQQMHADAVLENAQAIDVTADAAISWRSSNTDVATVDRAGLVLGQSQGTAIITAIGTNADGSQVEDSANITVNAAVATALQVTPKNTMLAAGLTQDFKAEALLSDGRVIDVTKNANLTWQSSEPSIASVDNDADSKGMVTALTQGAVTISASATLGGVSLVDTAELEVTAAKVERLEISPQSASIPAGFIQAFTANAVLSDGTVHDVTTNVQWSSDNTTVAQLSEDASGAGVVNGLSQGIANITATLNVDGAVFSDAAVLTVTNAVLESLYITPRSAVIPVGFSYDFSAIAQFSDGTSLNVTRLPALSWTTEDTSVATVNNSLNKGQVQAESVGRTRVTAALSIKGREYLSASASLTVTNAVMTSLHVTPVGQTLPIGLVKPFTATAYFSDDSALDVTHAPFLSWYVDQPAVATISSSGADKGNAKGLSQGETKITATSLTPQGEPMTGSAMLKVTNAAVMYLQVTPAVDTIPVGLSKAFTATAIMSDGTSLEVTDDPSIHWTSDDSDIASISSGLSAGNGVAEGKSFGKVGITATAQVDKQLYSVKARLDVTNAIPLSLDVAPDEVSLPAGVLGVLTATLTLSDDSKVDVTDKVHWQTGDKDIVGVNSSGVITAHVQGSTSVSAMLLINGDWYQDSSTVNVTAAVLEQVNISPESAEVPVGLTQAYRAQAIYSDGSIVDITHLPNTSWISRDPAIATISSSGLNKGVATGASEGGPVTILVNNRELGARATATLTVSTAVLTAIEVTPTSVDVKEGATEALTAKGIYSDGSEQDITDVVGWSGQDTEIATVVSGDVTGVSMGDTSVVASLNGIDSNTVSIHVSPALVSITVTPANVTIWEGETQQLTALGTFSDGSKTDITAQVLWLVTDPMVAVISQGELGGVVSAGILANATTKAKAELAGIQSEHVDIAVCSSLAGPCIDVFDNTVGDGSGKLFTSSPSVKYLDYIGGSDYSDIYSAPGSEDMSPAGDFYLFEWAQANSLCTTFNNIALSGRTNWRLATKDELASGLYGAHGNMFHARGWPASHFFWSSTKHSGSAYYDNIDLTNGEVHFSSSTTDIYASCVSAP